MPLEAVQDIVLMVFNSFLVFSIEGGSFNQSCRFLQPFSMSSLGLVSSAPFSRPQLAEKHFQMCQGKSSLRSSLVMDLVRSTKGHFLRLLLLQLFPPPPP